MSLGDCGHDEPVGFTVPILLLGYFLVHTELIHRSRDWRRLKTTMGVAPGSSDGFLRIVQEYVCLVKKCATALIPKLQRISIAPASGSRMENGLISYAAPDGLEARMQRGNSHFVTARREVRRLQPTTPQGVTSSIARRL